MKYTYIERKTGKTLQSASADLDRERYDLISEDKHDPVNNPSHYTSGKIEVIDFIEDKGLNFHRGNVIKYVARADKKGKELEDLKKAMWYLQREINRLEGL